MVVNKMKELGVYTYVAKIALTIVAMGLVLNDGPGYLSSFLFLTVVCWRNSIGVVKNQKLGWRDLLAGVIVGGAIFLVLLPTSDELNRLLLCLLGILLILTNLYKIILCFQRIKEDSVDKRGKEKSSDQ